MNNPLEAVTQAVNSLVTALKLPDESAKANEVLGEMSFPQFSRLLPYRDYNQESGLFMNDTTMGFMLEAIPINGANESIVEALDHMLRTKLPRGIPLCIHLMSSQLVGDRIEYGLREFSWSGEQAERFNAITRAYYMKAAATQFPLPEGMNLPLTLRHYRVFISYCSPSKKKSRADILEMENLVKIIRASLQGASITTQTVDAQAFIEIVGEMINHNPDSLYPKRRQLDSYSDLNYQCVEDSFDLKVRADYLTLGLRENGRNSTARILNFHLARNPEIAFLWNMADNYSNLLNPELSISCPFILTLTLVVEDQVKTHSEANLKYMDLEKKSKTSYAKWFPSVEKEAKEWGELRQRLGSGQSSVVSYFLNITAFCKDNNETALEVEQDILNSFRKNGFELISPRFNHMRNFLTCLPFMAGKGLFKQLKEAGVVQRAESFNVANLMPLVADNPLTPAGLLAPTYRNQLAFIDIFFRGMNNTNYNMAVCGTSGAGKTGLIQPLIRSVLDSGGFAVVFDMGDGYKSLCENMGGVYLDGETLRFNPFANITDIDQSAERVRDQLSVMASPNGNLDEVHEGLLLQAVKASWLAKKNQARIDDVVNFLKNASDSEQYAESPTIRSRLDEMIVLLDQYTANGTYGRYFNSDEPSLRDDARMVVLELGGLEDRPSLLVAVMFSLIIYIENRMYRTPRNLKKLNVIDEGWRLLDFKNHKVGEFIEKGYRTARRHTGAYITITQNIVDFDSDKASSAARAAWGNSSYKIILKQSAKEFAKYNQLYRAGSDFAHQIKGQGSSSIQGFKPQESIPGYNANPDETKYYGGVTAGGDGGLKNDGTTEWATGETGKTITESFMNKPKDILSPDAPFIQTGRDVVNRADSIVGNTGQQCSAQEISRSEYTNYTCERDLQVEQYCTRTARMELQGSTTWETRTLEYEMSQLPAREVNGQYVVSITSPVTGEIVDAHYSWSRTYLQKSVPMTITVLGTPLSWNAKYSADASFTPVQKTLTAGVAFTSSHPVRVGNTKFRRHTAMKLRLVVRVKKASYTPYVVWSESCPFSKELGKLTKTECTEAGGNRTLVKDGQSYSMYQSCWA
ncbi:type IV secretion system protein TraC [Escherichia coli]|uniref:type IV secretion system protein TraC n=20 Tax=Enterobacteriaceae TaxID=543 RepID=UPI00388E57AC